MKKVTREERHAKIAFLRLKHREANGEVDAGLGSALRDDYRRWLESLDLSPDLEELTTSHLDDYYESHKAYRPRRDPGDEELEILQLGLFENEALISLELTRPVTMPMGEARRPEWTRHHIVEDETRMRFEDAANRKTRFRLAILSEFKDDKESVSDVVARLKHKTQ